jgi:hypothetical protein
MTYFGYLRKWSKILPFFIIEWATKTGQRNRAYLKIPSGYDYEEGLQLFVTESVEILEIYDGIYIATSRKKRLKNQKATLKTLLNKIDTELEAMEMS